MSESAAWEWASKGESRALPFFDFRHGLTIFSFDFFATFIRNSMKSAMVGVGFALGLWMAVEKNQRNRSIFALSTVLRRRLPVDERMLGFVTFG